MLGKLIGALIALLFLGGGVAVLTGTLTIDSFDPEKGSRKIRALNSLLHSSMESLGAMPTGGIMVGIGLVILVLTMRGGKKDKGGK